MKRLDYRWALVVLPALAALVSPIPGSAEPAAGGQRHTASRIEPQISAITLGVRDLEASYRFYEGGLGLPAQRTPSDGIVFFSTTGTKLFLFPYSKLAADAGFTSPDGASRSPFPGFTLGHVVRTKSEVDRVLALAVNSGGKMVKAAHETSWGGYSGYFSDPDGYLWEVLYAPNLRFAPDGTVIVP